MPCWRKTRRTVLALGVGAPIAQDDVRPPLGGQRRRRLILNVSLPTALSTTDGNGAPAEKDYDAAGRITAVRNLNREGLVAATPATLVEGPAMTGSCFPPLRCNVRVSALLAHWASLLAVLCLGWWCAAPAEAAASLTQRPFTLTAALDSQASLELEVTAPATIRLAADWTTGPGRLALNIPRRSYCAGMRGDSLEIAFDGTVYLCGYIRTAESVLGNALTGSVTALLDDARTRCADTAVTVDQIPSCTDCRYALVCAGGCGALAYHVTGDMHGSHPCCADLYALLHEIEDDLAKGRLND